MLNGTKPRRALRWPLAAVYGSLLVWSSVLGWRWMAGVELAPDPRLSGSLLSPGDDAQRPVSNVMVVFGTTADAVKAAPIVRHLHSHPANCTPVLVRVGGGYDDAAAAADVLDAFGLQVSLDLSTEHGGKDASPESELRSALGQFGAAVRAYRPDRVLVLGDTLGAYAAALAAFYEKVEVSHVPGTSSPDAHDATYRPVHRAGIADIAARHFVADSWAADRLKGEGRPVESVMVTGSPEVDALQDLISRARPGDRLTAVLARARELGSVMVLLTTEQAETRTVSLPAIISAISKSLAAHPDLVVVYVVDGALHDRLSEILPDPDSRLLLLPTPSYTDLVLAASACARTVTDSSRHLEQALALGKTAVLLGNTTAFPEAVHDGALTIVDASTNLTAALDDLFLHPPALVDVFGSGGSAQRIASALMLPAPAQSAAMSALRSAGRPVLVLTLTVWHRAMLETQLGMIRDQLGLGGYALRVVVFQNGAHLDVRDTVRRWSEPAVWAPDFDDVRLYHVHSVVETGYYGRFLAPLSVDAADDDFFILFDDDILWGRRYLANMLRVVRSGSLATRNGRFITPELDESGGCSFKGRGDLFFDEDIRYDYGGHIWAGRIGWLRTVWRYPPPTFMHNEDFWISAVLKTQLNVTTKKPRCPRPVQGRGRPEFCACSAKNAIDHIDPVVGEGATADYKQRLDNFRLFIGAYNYTLIAVSEPDLLQRECDAHRFVEYGSVWILDEPRVQDCYSWV